MSLTRDELIVCMQACINSYNGRHGVVDYSIFDQVEQFDIRSCEGFFAKRGDMDYVVFRGSDQVKDWLLNVSCGHSTAPYGNTKGIKVHTGFIKTYELVRTFIHTKVGTKPNIVVTGHSLGGALATLCALDLQYCFGKNITCVPVASPRVGNKLFAESFNRRLPGTIRLTHGADLIPMVPLPVMGYRHIGTEFHIGRQRLIPSIADHFPERYYQALTEGC